MTTKKCSKCERELELSSFVKSDRYKDGKYPSCKECRKAVRVASLAAKPMCSKCGVRPHTPTHNYCYECQRIAMGTPEPPKFRRDATNKDRCCRCKVNPKAKGKQYCYGCANQYAKDRAAKNGGYWAMMTPEQKQKNTVRRFINHRFERGTEKRQPCAVCGKPPTETEAHHLDYKPRTLNVIHLCEPHHDDVGKLVKTGLTDHEAVEYLRSKLSC